MKIVKPRGRSFLSNPIALAATAAGVAVGALILSSPARAATTTTRTPPPPGKFVDLTAVAPADKRSARSGGRPRDVVLHQMGFARGPDPRKYTGVTAHFVVTTDGTVAQLHPFESRLSASNGFNDSSIAIEFAGNLQSDRGEWWEPERFGADLLTSQQIEAGRKLLAFLRGLGFINVFAHRQSGAERQNDPGPEVWSQVGQWAVANQDYGDGGDGYKIGNGRSIPNSWREYQLSQRKVPG